MNKKPVHTDFLNLQWKPAPMFYGFKPNVRPYILPNNRGKLPMPKSGHIQFGRVSATDNADFNPLPNKPELQLPGKIFYTQPIPQQKFLNAATVKLINSGKVKPQFRSDQKVNPLSMPIISKIGDNNLKLISLEMVKNSILGLKYDPTLGTEQQQLQARSAYDNLIVCYSSLVNNDQASAINVQKIITQYEKDMVAVYGPRIKKPVATDLLNDALAKINELDATLTKLYETVKTNGGVLVEPGILVEPGEFGGDPEEEKQPAKIFSGELPPPYEEKEAEDEASTAKPTVAIMNPDDIIKKYENAPERDTFIGDILNDEQVPFNNLLLLMDTNWTKKGSYSANVLQNISSKILAISNYYVDKNGVGVKQRIPSKKVLNVKETREDIIRELAKIYTVVVQNRALDRIEAAKATLGPPKPPPPKVPTPPPSPKVGPQPPKAGPPTPPKVATPPPSPKGAPQPPPPQPPPPKVPMDTSNALLKLQNKKYKKDLIEEFNNTDDPIQTMNDFFKYIEEEKDKTTKDFKNTLKRTWQNINKASVRIENTDLSPADKISDPDYTPAQIDATILKVKTAALLLLNKIMPPQAGPGRKRKSRKRPTIKSVKKLSADVNNQILRLLRS